MRKLGDLKVKLFTDGADNAQIVAMAKQPWIAGFTTSPSLLKKAGVADYEAMPAISSSRFRIGIFRSVDAARTATLRFYLTPETARLLASFQGAIARIVRISALC